MLFLFLLGWYFVDATLDSSHEDEHLPSCLSMQLSAGDVITSLGALRHSHLRLFRRAGCQSQISESQLTLILYSNSFKSFTHPIDSNCQKYVRWFWSYETWRRCRRYLTSWNGSVCGSEEKVRYYLLRDDSDRVLGCFTCGFCWYRNLKIDADGASRPSDCCWCWCGHRWRRPGGWCRRGDGRRRLSERVPWWDRGALYTQNLIL